MLVRLVTTFAILLCLLVSNAAISPIASATPAVATTDSISGVSSAGSGNQASVTALVNPSCSGGTSWNGNACVCPVGQKTVDGQCFAPLPATACGVERWRIKTTADAGAINVNTRAALPSSISALTAIPAPGTPPNLLRIAPVETSVYAIDATLTLYRFTDDSDYHLVLSDGAGKTMIVELPHPDCVDANSPFKTNIASVRSTFDSTLRATTSFKSTSIPVRIHGVGFFDRLHGQTGVAPNGIELHPVLNIQFNPTVPLASDPSFALASDTDRFFNWAEASYAQFFPGPGTPGVTEPYRYRYYSSTENFIAVANGRVILHNGRDWNLLDLGTLESLLPLATGAGY